MAEVSVDAGDWISLGSVAVAVRSACVALWQVRSTKRHAEEQLELAKRQIEAAHAEANEAAGPDFAVVAADLMEIGGWAFTATVEMVQGPALAHVDVTVRGEHVKRLMFATGDRGVSTDMEKISWPHVSCGAVLVITADMGSDVSDPANLTIDLECLELDGQARRWTRSVTASAYKDRRLPVWYPCVR